MSSVTERDEPTAPARAPLTRWLSRQGGWVLNLYAVSAAFATYFCMYAFRKPFAAATYEGESFVLLGGSLTQKNLFIIAQLLGYALSKYLGIRVNPGVARGRRFGTLVGLIIAAEAALLAFAAVPEGWGAARAAALFANGLPLGMVWGLVVQYLEGRRMSEVLLTGLSCSYILASAVVKDVGRAILAGADSVVAFVPNPFPPLSEFWMPAAAGAVFFPAFLLSAWLLEQLPDPNPQDEAERVHRSPMPPEKRREFLRRYWFAIATALATYFALTGFRDYRDMYMVEAFTELNYDYEENESIISWAETIVAFGVAAVLSQLYRFRDNRRGLAATFAMMAGGLLLMGGATLLLDAGWITGFWWIVLTGLGAYTAYIPFGAMLFDRAIAVSGAAGTAVFGIYIADAIGYTGSVALYLTKDAVFAGLPHLDMLRGLAYAIAIFGSALLATSLSSFLRRSASSATPKAAAIAASPASI